jgi:outer membrane usher protein
VNDVLVRRVPVQPGEFHLTNITPLVGAGTTRYVIRDAYGQEQRLEWSYYGSSGVLAAGLSEYEYGLGFVREDFGRQSFRYGRPAAIARHRYGLTDSVTPGLHAEFDGSLANAGANLTLAGTFGEVELHLAGSVAIDRAWQGAASILGYSYRGSRASLRTLLRSTSRRYVTLSLGPEQHRSLLEQVTATSYSLGSRASLSSDIGFALSHARTPLARFTLGLSVQLTNALGLNVRASRSSAFELGRWDHDVFSTLSWALPLQHFAQLSEHTGGRGTDVSARLSRSVPYPAGVGYQVGASVGAQTQALANVQAQSSFGAASATYGYARGVQSTLLDASGGVVFVAGKLHFTQAGSQAFALLRVPGAPDVRGYLNNREMGSTDASGEVFVPGLAPYQSNLLRINQADLPSDYQFDQEEIPFAPPRRGGAVIEFVVRPMRLTRGRLVRGVGPAATPIKYGVVRVEVPSGTLTSLLGPDGEFELDGLPEGHWVGQVESVAGECRAPLEVRATQAPVQYLGTVSCVPSAVSNPTPGAP